MQTKSKANYRQRCYEGYVDSKFSVSHSLSPGEFEFSNAIEKVKDFSLNKIGQQYHELFRRYLT